MPNRMSSDPLGIRFPRRTENGNIDSRRWWEMAIRLFLVRKNPDTRLLIFALFLAAAALWAGCSSGRGDPLAAGDRAGDYGGLLISGADGPNLAVTDQNRLDLCQEVFSQLYSVYLKAVPAVITSPVVANGVRVLGNYKGYAVVRDLTDIPDSLENNQTLYFDLTVTFFDYSESGLLYIGGGVGCSTSMKKSGNQWLQEDLLLSDGLAFAGNFSGSIEFEDFLLPVDPAGGLISFDADEGVLGSHRLTGNVVIKSGDQTFRFNPYYQSPIPQ